MGANKLFLWPSRVKPYAAPIYIIGKDQGFFTAKGRTTFTQKNKDYGSLSLCHRWPRLQ
jgi:hypothetical protein